MRLIHPVVVLCLFSLAWVGAQAESKSNTAPPLDADSQQTRVANAGDEPVGPGDLVYVSVTGAPELTRSYRVSKEGRLSLPLLHLPVPVGGMGPAAISDVVSEALIKQHILVAPIVSTQVIEYRSRRVTVAGAVKSPVIIEATGNLRLLDAIARAKGFGPEAGPEIIVSHARTGAGTPTTVHVPIKDLLADKDSDLNLRLHGGEDIRVPEAAKLYIVGNVKQPGIYPMNEVEGLSVLKALAVSQGTIPYAAKHAYVYRAIAGSADRQEIEIPLRDILQRKLPDVQLQANDVLYIPENSRARLNAAILHNIVGLATGTAALPVRR